MVLRNGQEAHAIESYLTARPGLFGCPLNGLVVTFSLMLREGGGGTFTIRVTGQIHIDEGITRRNPKIRIR
jgi:hypothetical protein